VTGQNSISDVWSQVADAIHEWRLDAEQRLAVARQRYNDFASGHQREENHTGVPDLQRTAQEPQSCPEVSQEEHLH
jgi:hypothetical protein